MNSHYRDWNINIEAERKFWLESILGSFIILPKICPYCKKGAIGLKKQKILMLHFKESAIFINALAI